MRGALRREIRVLRLTTFGSLLLSGSLLLTALAPERREARLKVLEVERINVVQPDGKLAMVIANTPRLPGIIHDGKETPSERRASGMLFYNGSGDEAGGLIYSSQQRPDGGYTAGANLTFDQYRQDQVVQLTYQDQNARPAAGLLVTDRPTHITTTEYLALRDRARSATGAERERLEQELRAREEAGEFWAQRIFVGSLNRSAMVRLKDTRGRTRIRLVVDSADVARIEFFDSAGKVVRTFPE